jgi:hypothetical protein
MERSLLKKLKVDDHRNQQFHHRVRKSLSEPGVVTHALSSRLTQEAKTRKIEV